MKHLGVYVIVQLSVLKVLVGKDPGGCARAAACAAHSLWKIVDSNVQKAVLAGGFTGGQ